MAATATTPAESGFRAPRLRSHLLWPRSIRYFSAGPKVFRRDYERFEGQKNSTLSARTRRKILASLTVEEHLSDLPPEALVRVLAPEDRLRGLSPEALIRAQGAEDVEKLRQLLSNGKH